MVHVRNKVIVRVVFFQLLETCRNPGSQMMTARPTRLSSSMMVTIRPTRARVL